MRSLGASGGVPPNPTGPPAGHPATPSIDAALRVPQGVRIRPWAPLALCIDRREQGCIFLENGGINCTPPPTSPWGVSSAAPEGHPPGRPAFLQETNEEKTYNVKLRDIMFQDLSPRVTCNVMSHDAVTHNVISHYAVKRNVMPRGRSGPPRPRGVTPASSPPAT